MKNIILFPLVFLFTLHTHSQNFWQEAYTGNFYLPSLNVSANDNIFTVSDSFLVRSTDNGISWQTVYTASSLSNYYVFGASPTGVIYFNSDSLRKSTDEGNIWITATAPLGGSFIPLWFLITNNDGDIFTETGILAGGYSYRSTDEGGSWVQIGVPQAILQSISFHPNGYTYAVYMGNLPPGFSDLFKSSNKGDVWENIAAAPPLIQVVYVAKNGHIFVGTNTALFKSIDDGLTWNLLLNALVTDITENQLGHLFLSTTSTGVFKSTDDGINWQQINSGLAYLSATKLTLDSLGYLYVIAGANQYSQIKLYRSVESTIPVELVSFAADLINNEVHLNWMTSTETNNQGFEILRFDQNDKGGWNEIGFVAGHGTTTETSYYSFIDKGLSTEKYLYRLKQIDYDGSFEYSNMIEVEIGSVDEFNLSQNYPNPFNPSTKIKYSVPDVIASGSKQSQLVTIKVYDILGNEIATLVNEEKPAGSYEVEFNIHSNEGHNLPSGVYFYQLRIEGPEINSGQAMIQTKKMVLMK
jgi:photosystem II stability/assembly factor-like uncharacterized protein